MLPGLGFGPGGGPVTYGYGPASFIKIIIQAIANICRAIAVPFEQRIEKVEPDC